MIRSFLQNANGLILVRLDLLNPLGLSGGGDGNGDSLMIFLRVLLLLLDGCE